MLRKNVNRADSEREKQKDEGRGEPVCTHKIRALKRTKGKSKVSRFSQSKQIILVDRSKEEN